jgi:nucleoside-diphosphate-sugar epimerase
MILVTGGTGFIGRHLVERLVAKGRPVRCLVRSSSQLGGLPIGSIELANGDLASGPEGASLAQALEGVDTVIHLAGITKARAVSDYHTGNAAATANLLRAAGDVRRFVHVSSLAAAGPSERDRAIDEETEPHPVSHYGRSKLAGEEAVRKSALWERSVIVRPPVVYGPRDTDVFQVIAAAARGWIVRLGRAERRFSMIYVGDLVEGLMAAADREGAGGRIYFMAHTESASWDEFGSEAARIMGRTARIVTIPEKAAYAMGACAEWWSKFSGKPGILSRDKVTEGCCAGWLCDAGRARRELGFSAPTGMEEGLRRTLDWYKEAGWLKF